jgi:hypothetical protein
MATYIESLISVFKRAVLWDHRNKAYHNRDLVDKEWDNVSQAVGITSRYKHQFNFILAVYYARGCTLNIFDTFSERFQQISMKICMLVYFIIIFNIYTIMVAFSWTP